MSKVTEMSINGKIRSGSLAQLAVMVTIMPFMVQFHCNWKCNRGLHSVCGELESEGGWLVELV